MFPVLECSNLYYLELKLKSTKYCVLSASGNDNVNGNANDDVNGNNIIFTINNTKLHVPVVTLSVRHNQELSKLFSKEFDLKDQFESKTTTSELRFRLKPNFFGVNRLFVLVYLNRDNDTKQFKTRRYYLLKGIIKNYNVIINGKNFYDQAVDSDIKRYKEIRKLITGKGGDHTTGCLSNYDCIKSYLD